jgi:integrase
MAARLERGVARQQEGYFTPDEEEQKRPLLEHLNDFERYLAAKGNAQEHVSRTVNQVRTVLNRCDFHRITDVQPSKVIEFLGKLRRTVECPELDSSREQLGVKEVAQLLGIRPASVHRLVKRGHLVCQGIRRRKQFAREAVASLVRNRTRGVGVETSNHYLIAIKAFTRWLVRDQRSTVDPLAFVSRQNPDVDVRHRRRALSEPAFHRFIEATASGTGFRGLSGIDRLVLYTLASQTGFRVKELGSLKPASFSLETTPATVTVEAAYSKHRREDVQPLRKDVADLMRQYLADKPMHARIWSGTWVKVAAEMVRKDLAEAGIPYKENGRCFDFHAIRGQFISSLAANNVHPKVAQILARHSSINLTMDHYTHLDALNITGALDNLPKLRSAGVSKGKATG